MVIVLQKGISEKDKNQLKVFLEKNKFRVNEIKGDEDTILGAVGQLSIDPREVEILPGVARVIPISKPYKMASREYKKDNSVVEIKTSGGHIVRVGGLRVSAIAGPCAVESRSQMMSVAKAVAAAGAVMLRGGAYKPRTSPYAFQGLGEEGVKILKDAGDAYGLPVVTEIVSAEHISVMKDAIDVFQIGARNMQNFELLKKVGALGKPVILKRGLSATIEEWLMAAEYLLASGTNDVILCERGIRTYEKATRNTLDISAIPVLRSLTHLPIIVDPSHAVGIRDKVPPMALASIAAGADGIIVEVHCNPDKALSDGAQSLYPEQFEKLMRDIEVLAPVIGREVSRLPRNKPSNPIAALYSRNEKNIVCAFSGGRGAYAEQAIEHYFDEDIQSLALDSFKDIFAAVLDGRADYGMIPIENSLAGSVFENYDNLHRFEDTAIVGSIKLRITHSLLGVGGASLETIKNVYSHPQGFAQCATFLETQGKWEHIESLSTATAAQNVSKIGSPQNAAIASDVTARLYHLEVIKTGIEDDPRNFTRFIIITDKNKSRIAQAKAPHTATDTVAQDVEQISIAQEKNLRATIVFATKNESGSLYQCLGLIQKYALNMTRLESRPIHGQPWHYLFYVDIALADTQNAEHDDEQKIYLMLEDIKVLTNEVRLLGIYEEK